MIWIKRNLFFVIGGFLALGMLGGAGFYIYKSWDRNSTAFNGLTDVVNTLKGLTDQHPSPGNDKIDNTKIAKEQDKEVRKWIGNAMEAFQPISPIPTGAVTSEAYAGALRRTIDQLQKQAEISGVSLPPKYDFSFAAQRPLVKFAAGSLEPLSVQLGEVRALCEILFSTRINALDGIKRIRVSDDDMTGPQSDYIEEHSVTNDLAVITPYVLNFRCFTPELSRVMAGFATASNTFIVKAVNVQMASAESVSSSSPSLVGPPGMIGEGYPMRRIGVEGYPVAPTQPVPAQPVIGKGGLQTVLKEQLLRVTMEVGLVKLSPKS
jgi:hypothetical protein